MRTNDDGSQRSAQPPNGVPPHEMTSSNTHGHDPAPFKANSYFLPKNAQLSSPELYSTDSSSPPVSGITDMPRSKGTDVLSTPGRPDGLEQASSAAPVTAASKQEHSPAPALLPPMPSLVTGSSTPSFKKGHRSTASRNAPSQPKSPISTPGPTYFSSPKLSSPPSTSSVNALSTKPKDPSSFGHVRSQSSVNLSSAMKEARDGQYRHSKLASTALLRPNINSALALSELSAEPTRARAYTHSQPNSNNTTKHAQRNSFNLGDIPGLKKSIQSSLVPPGQTNNGLLAPPAISFLSQRKGAHRKHRDSGHHSDSEKPSLSLHRSSSATSLLSLNSNESEYSSVSSEASFPKGTIPASPPFHPLTDPQAKALTESSAVSEHLPIPRLFDKTVTMATGVSELKAHLSSTLTSYVNDSENGLKQQLHSFEVTFEELKSLREHCSKMVSSFVAASESSDASIQERLKVLRDQMSSFKVLDTLETRIAEAHAAIDAHKTKLDTVNKWVSLKEAKARLWRKRMRAARRVFVLSTLVLLIAIFSFKIMFSNDTPQETWTSNTRLAQDESYVKMVASSDAKKLVKPDAPLEDIVSWLGNIDEA